MAKALFDSGQHHVSNPVAAVSARARHPSHGFPVAAIERESHAQRFAIVAAEFETVGAPARVAVVDRDTAVMPTLDAREHPLAFQRQGVVTHDPIDPLGVHWGYPLALALPA